MLLLLEYFISKIKLHKLTTDSTVCLSEHYKLKSTANLLCWKCFILWFELQPVVLGIKTVTIEMSIIKAILFTSEFMEKQRMFTL